MIDGIKLLISALLITVGIGAGYFLFKTDPPQIISTVKYTSDTTYSKIIDSLHKEITNLKASPTKIKIEYYPVKDTVYVDSVVFVPIKIYTLDTLTSYKDSVHIKFYSTPIEKFEFNFIKHPDTINTITIRDSVLITNTIVIDKTKLFVFGPTISTQIQNNKIGFYPGFGLTVDIIKLADKLWPF